MVSASWPLIVVVLLVLLNKHDFSMLVRKLHKCPIPHHCQHGNIVQMFTTDLFMKICE